MSDINITSCIWAHLDDSCSCQYDVQICAHVQSLYLLYVQHRNIVRRSDKNLRGVGSGSTIETQLRTQATSITSAVPKALCMHLSKLNWTCLLEFHQAVFVVTALVLPARSCVSPVCFPAKQAHVLMFVVPRPSHAMPILITTHKK